MIGDTKRIPLSDGRTAPVVSWFYLPIYCGGSDWNCLVKFLDRHRPPRYLLCRGTLSLRSFDRSRLFNHGWVYSLIPSNIRDQHKSENAKSTVLYNVCGSQPNLL